ncbi:hypothetical protein T492DRAFT_952578 [Pavlovales sp. CCMP2436]|nr:hypothetical protein T492DRAFT_952578 [Pavlovales sp. CCMP2436]|mmetsp:Transcript_35296/g.88032  ORF Transcript_35296/g.88032 Transcript_35296/m.88032 type:complete len:256 (+) Transcript_35296:68-835(+)
MRDLAEEQKEYGNACLAKGKIEAALAAYSEAICLNPRPTYYTNRAFCHKRKGDWAACVADCESALQLDDRAIKAHYLLGGALAELGGYERATSHLRRALGLTSQTSVSYGADIRRAMLHANKMRWQCDAAASLRALDAAEPLLQQHARALADGGEVLASIERALREVRTHLDPTQAVPDFLCCAISLELLEDPVTTPCGFTYERKALEEHLRAVGRFEPHSRKPLEAGQAVPNLAIRKAVEAFLEANPWAHGCLL